MPGKTHQFGETLYELISRMINNKIVGFSSGGRLNLGGGEGADGGVGGPPSDFIGQLTQRKVAYDTTQAQTPELYAVTRSGWENSLLDNLNHIRYWQDPARWFEPIFDDSFDVTIRGGKWWRGANVILDFVTDNITVTSSDVLPRIDVIYVNTAGDLAISEGTPHAIPEPAYPAAASLSVCELYIKAAGTAGVTISGLGYLYQSGYAQGYLQRDIRPFFGANFDSDVSGVEVLSDLDDVATTLPDHREVLMYDDGISLWRPATMLEGGVAGGHPTLQIDGPITPLTHVGGAYICTREGDITQVYMYCEDTGSVDATIIDVNLNFVSIFSVSGERPSLAYDDINKVQKSDILSGVAFSSEDVITIDIDQIATGAKGLTVVVALDTPLDTPSSHSHSDGLHTGVLHLDEFQDGVISGYPLLSEGNYLNGDPRYGQITTVGIQNYAITDDKAGNRVPVVPKRQGGHATSWWNPGTTDYTPDQVKIQTGSYEFIGGGATTKVITFPESFSNVPVVFVSRYTTSAGQAPSARTLSATKFTLVKPDGPANNRTIFWMAIGPR